MNRAKRLGCPDCNYDGWEVRNRQKIKDPRYGVITIEMRLCKNVKCGKRYRVANNGVQEFYY